jgi:hypothetical protein
MPRGAAGAAVLTSADTGRSSVTATDEEEALSPPLPDEHPGSAAKRASTGRTRRAGRATQRQYGNARLGPFGLWRSLVARSVRVGEVPSSNLGSPTTRSLRRTPGRTPHQAVGAQAEGVIDGAGERSSRGRGSTGARRSLVCPFV